MYQCMFPDCTYHTKNRNKLDYHHIIPKELGGSDHDYNRIYLCPNHHRHIFIPESNNGIHSLKSIESIIINGQLNSTMGKCLMYTRCDTGEDLIYVYSKKIILAA